MLAVSSSAFATSDAWDGSTSNVWSVNTNWLTDPATVPGTTETATFNNAGNGNTTIDLGAGVTIGQVVFDTAAAASYTIGSGAVGSQTLTLGTVGNAITMTSTVAANQLFNSNIALGNTGNGTYTFQNNSTTNSLTIAGGISASTAGTKILSVTGSGNTAISGAITAGTGVMNLSKFGTGTLTLSGGGVLGAGGITNGNSAVLSAVLLGGTTKITSGTYTSAGEFVVGGVLANGGAGVNTNFTMDGGSLTIANYLSLGRGNGIGAVSSDIVLNNNAAITSANFSAGFNGGNAANLSKGTFTLNGTSNYTISANGVFNFAESAGSNLTMTLNNSSTLTVAGSGNKFIGNGGTGVLTLNGTSSADFGTGLIAVGQQNGNGTLNVNTGATFNSSTEIRVAYSGGNGTFSGSGTINVNGGTLNTNALTVGRNNNDVASSLNATVNVSNGGTFNVRNSTSLIGWRGIGTNATVNISGGSFNQGTTATTNMSLGSFTGANAAVNVSGGALTFQNNSSLRFADTAGANASTRSLTISGGSVTFYSDAGTTTGGTGTIDLMLAANALGTNTINLDGGTLTANQIKATSATGTRVINFNGGTLKAGATGLASTFLASGVATTANVRNGGAKLDSNGLNVTIGQALNHSAIGGDNATDGGLTKSGAGSLTLTAVNTYNGATVVNQGTLALGATASLASTSLNVANGATFSTAAQASYSLASLASGITMNLDASTGGFVNGGAGAYTLGNALTLNFSTNALVLNQAYNLFDYASQTGDFASVSLTGALSGTLTRSGEIWTGTAGGNGFSFDETSGILTVVAVPEPTVALLGALGAFTLLRRRRVAA